MQVFFSSMDTAERMILSLSKGVPIETLSSILGHTSIRTTQIYAKITNKKISQDMNALAERIRSLKGPQ